MNSKTSTNSDQFPQQKQQIPPSIEANTRPLSLSNNNHNFSSALPPAFPQSATASSSQLDSANNLNYQKEKFSIGNNTASPKLVADYADLNANQQQAHPPELQQFIQSLSEEDRNSFGIGLNLFQMKKILLADLGKITDKFDELKHRLYTNKERLLERELSQLKNSQHPHLRQQLEELERQKARRVEVSSQKNKFLLHSYQNEYQSTVAAIYCNYNERRKIVRRHMVRRYQRRLLDLASEYHLSLSNNYSNDTVIENSFEAGCLPEHLEPLSPAEIDHDLVAIRNAPTKQQQQQTC